MATEHSFDIVAEIDFNEFTNAHQQALKLIANRYDFKGKVAELEVKKGEKLVEATGSEEYVVDAMMEIFHEQLAKRGIDLKALSEKSKAAAPGGHVRKVFEIRDAMKPEEAKEITKALKSSKMKARASIQGESVRVTGKSLDELQEVQKLVKGLELGCPIRFTNYK